MTTDKGGGQAPPAHPAENSAKRGSEAAKLKGRKPKAAEANEPIEKQLWKTADKLRKNIDAAEYKHIVLGRVTGLRAFRYNPSREMRVHVSTVGSCA